MGLFSLLAKMFRGATADRPAAARVSPLRGMLSFFFDTTTETLSFCSLASGVPEWQTVALGSFVATSTLTTHGDVLVRGLSAPERLAIGTSGQVLTSNGTTAVWSTPATAAARALVGPWCQDNVANGQTATPATLGASGASVGTYVPARAGSVTAISMFCAGGYSGDFGSTHGAPASITASVHVNGTAITETCALVFSGGSAIPGRVSVTIAAGLRTFAANDAITVTIASTGSLVLSDDIQVWVETTES